MGVVQSNMNGAHHLWIIDDGVIPFLGRMLHGWAPAAQLESGETALVPVSGNEMGASN